MKNIDGTQLLQPLTEISGKAVLAIGAHPDDLELGVGGTLASLAAGGNRVVTVVVSIPSQLETRKTETRKAAEILGCEARFMIPDRTCRVEDIKIYRLVGMIDDLIKELNPMAVFSHCYNNFHMDHKLVYEACIASQRLAYFDHFCYSPISCRPINVSFSPHAFIDISDHIETKIKAVEAHYSQFGQRSLETDYCREMDRRYGRLIGVEYAEGLEISRLRIHGPKYAEAAEPGRPSCPAAEVNAVKTLRAA